SRRAAGSRDPQGVRGPHVPGDRGDAGPALVDGEDAAVPGTRAAADAARAPGNPGRGGRARGERMNTEQGDVMDCDGIRSDMLDVLYGEGGEGAARRVEAHHAVC